MCYVRGHIVMMCYVRGLVMMYLGVVMMMLAVGMVVVEAEEVRMVVIVMFVITQRCRGLTPPPPTRCIVFLLYTRSIQPPLAPLAFMLHQ